jgi:hypothetical protein
MLLSVMIYDALVAPAFARMGRPITPMQRLGARAELPGRSGAAPRIR